MRIIPHIVCLILCPALLLGCGFHLRGALPLPENRRAIFLETKTPYSGFSKDLRNTFTQAGYRFTGNAKQANWVLALEEAPFMQRVKASNDLSANQHTIAYSITFSIKNKSGKMLILPKHLMQQITLPNGENGENYNRQAILSLRQSVIDQIVSRIQGRAIRTAIMREGV